MLRRPRRNRKSAVVRGMVEETRLSVKDFIFPLFLIDGTNRKIEVDSMPGIFRYSPDLMLKEIEACMELGIMSFDIFAAYPESKKDKYASESHNPDTFYLKTIQQIKRAFPE